MKIPRKFEEVCVGFVVTQDSGADLGSILNDFLDEHQRCKLLGVSGACCPLRKFLGLNSPKSPFLGF